ncbi:hypothetical protein [Pantoea sp. AS-PWVM4]|uniref:hypothetical protein n=1 Tax=Pantoea sp. AS-PWVM4 TaxID=1332069 RepID=UPI000561AE89|nr:hypothetical protein [Pantoea sp. AS-PWVM4]
MQFNLFLTLLMGNKDMERELKAYNVKEDRRPIFQKRKLFLAIWGMPAASESMKNVEVSE